MLDRLSLTHFYAHRDPTYVSLSLEFLSSLVYTTNSLTANTVGTAKFRMFNMEYEFNLNQMADLLQFPRGEDVICETPLDTDWPYEVNPFWEKLISNHTDSFEGNNTTQIHNSTIRYFRQMLAHAIFGRENKSRINVKELFYIYSIFEHTLGNSAPFLLAYMQAVRTAKKRHIAFGGLITSIARTQDLHDPLPMLSLEIDVCRHMRLIKNISDGRFSLMIANRVVPCIILPCPNRTDVRVRENSTYNLNVGAKADLVPMDINENIVVDGDTNDEFDQREQCPPVHQHPPY